MKTNAVVTLILTGGVIILCPIVLDYLAFQNSQNNMIRLITETEMTRANVDSFQIDVGLKWACFILGSLLTLLGCYFVWFDRERNRNKTP